MSKLIDFAVTLLGLSQAPKLAPTGPRPALASSVVQDTEKPALPQATEPVATPARSVAPVLDNRYTWRQPVLEFQAADHLTDGNGLGYAGHSNDHFNLASTALRARFNRTVQLSLHLLDQRILETRQAKNEVGAMNPSTTENMQLDLDFLTKEHARWTTQLTLPVTDPESEYAPSYEQFRVGYELGMQRYRNDKRYADQNGLTNLLP